jgi:hypothetical protein
LAKARKGAWEPNLLSFDAAAFAADPTSNMHLASKKEKSFPKRRGKPGLTSLATAEYFSLFLQ